MKKRVIIFSLLITCLLGNPLVVKYINEIYFTSDSWAIEYTNHYYLDSAMVCSSRDTLYFSSKDLIQKDGSDHLYLCQDSLAQSFQINPYGDSLIISSYNTIKQEWEYGICDIIWGNGQVPAPRINDQSLCLNEIRFAHYQVFQYYLDNSPTIGRPNDRDNACSEITITVKDSTGRDMPAAVRFFPYDNQYFTGVFLDTILAASHDISLITNDSTYSFSQRFYPDSSIQIKFISNTLSSINQNKNNQSSQYNLLQNFPNPFNPTTTIQFYIPKQSLVNLSVYDMQGKLIEILISEKLAKGTYYKLWNATNHPSGIYIYQLKAQGVIYQNKCLLVK